MVLVQYVYSYLTNAGGKRFTKTHRICFFFLFAFGMIALELYKYVGSKFQYVFSTQKLFSIISN